MPSKEYIEKIFSTLKKNSITIASLICGVLIWEVCVDHFDIPLYLLPAPSAMIDTLFHSKIAWMQHTLITVIETLQGFIVAVIVGVGSALLVSSYRVFRSILYPYIIILHILPKIALAPLIVVWFGSGVITKVLLSFLIAFFPMLVDTLTGLEAVTPDMMNMVKSLSATKWQILTKLRLMNSLPYMFSGMRSGITLAFIGAVVGEFIASGEGLGYIIIASSTYYDTPVVFSALLITAGIGLLLFGIIITIQKLLLPWYEIAVVGA